MYEIPTSIEINNKKYNITNKGDYRMVLDCFNALEDAELPKTERIITALIIFYEDFNSIEDVTNFSDIQKAVEEMYLFFNCGQQESPGMRVNYKLIDWNQDSQIVCSAINNVANKEIRLEPYVHWWTFMGYYTAIGESLLSTIVSIRHKLMTGKKLEKHERQFRTENPQYFAWRSKTVEQEEADKAIRELWNSGK